MRALAARMLLSLLAVVGLTAVALLRLARVPRPVAVLLVAVPLVMRVRLPGLVKALQFPDA